MEDNRCTRKGYGEDFYAGSCLISAITMDWGRAE